MTYFEFVKFDDFPSFKLFIKVLLFRTFGTKLNVNMLLLSRETHFKLDNVSLDDMS